MRHRRRGRKLNRTSAHRKALGRNLIRNFFLQFGTDREFIVTTKAKAKEYQPLAEKLITLGKKDTVHARRKAQSILQDKKVTQKLFNEIAPRYKDRPGGYTRVIKTGAHRLGDGTRKTLLMFVEEKVEAAPSKPVKKD